MNELNEGLISAKSQRTTGGDHSTIAQNSDLNGIIPNIASLQEGLTSEEVRKRLMEYGYNEVLEKKGYSILRFVKKFWASRPGCWR